MLLNGITGWNGLECHHLLIVSIFLHSDKAAVRIGFTDYSTTSTLVSAIKNVPYDGGRTNTSGGIWMMVGDWNVRLSNSEL